MLPRRTRFPRIFSAWAKDSELWSSSAAKTGSTRSIHVFASSNLPANIAAFARSIRTAACSGFGDRLDFSATASACWSRAMLRSAMSREE